MTAAPLPPLPKEFVCTNGLSAYYTADQMQAYARKARADLDAESQRLRKVLAWIDKRCPAYFLEQSPHKIHWEAANDAGACARAALENEHA